MRAMRPARPAENAFTLSLSKGGAPVNLRDLLAALAKKPRDTATARR